MDVPKPFLRNVILSTPSLYDFKVIVFRRHEVKYTIYIIQPIVNIIYIYNKRGNLGSDSSYIENVNFDVRTRVAGVHFVIFRGRTRYIYGVCCIVSGESHIVRICLKHTRPNILTRLRIQYKYMILLYVYSSYYHIHVYCMEHKNIYEPDPISVTWPTTKIYNNTISESTSYHRHYRLRQSCVFEF